MKFIIMILFSVNLIHSQAQKNKTQAQKTPPSKIEPAKQTETKVQEKETKEELKDRIRESLKKREFGRFGDKRF